MSYTDTPKDAASNGNIRRPGTRRAAAAGQTIAGWFDETWRTVAGFFRPHRATPIEQAIAELRAYNDNELADLGIGRAQIVDAVLHGRSGIERPAA